ncbi:hypothetical protein [Actinomadura chokoriensis]|uniref:Winged helix-turn-helix domain-containing protein n=1 Tax=Actinomadura chokoriensis TaxID=454156 RepID=A0ABV4QTS2_9ACTN
MSSSAVPGVTGPARQASQSARLRNVGAVLREVHRDGAVSRTELADRMGVNRSTILTLREYLSRCTGTTTIQPVFRPR